MLKVFCLMPLLLSWGWSAGLRADSSYQRAQRVAAIVGIGRSGACSSCHATQSIQTIRRWAAGLDRVETCFKEKTAPDRMRCILGRELDQPFELAPSQLGFYSAGLHLPAFKQLLTDVYGEEQAATLSEKLAASTLMPLRSDHPLDAAAFEDLRNWVNEEMPFLDELLEPYDGPTTCDPTIDASLAVHLRAIAGDSWQSRNRERGLMMFGCPAGEACFSQTRSGQELFPLRPEWNADASFQLRQLLTFPAESSYWIRSSADGRFVAYGGGPSGIVDLQSLLKNPPETRVIRVQASYDPGFFPDDSAFMFQGNRTGICNMSLIKNPSTTRIDFSEDACTYSNSARIPLYQSIGASLDGTDYLAATGSFLSDIGDGTGPELFAAMKEKDFSLTEGNELYLYPLLYDGQRWVRQPPQVFATPWELDWGLAPSNQLLVSRHEAQMQHHWYQFYQLNRAAAQPYQMTPVGSLCFEGLKGNFSFDDRFFVTYSYIHPEQYAELGYASAEDPAFKALLEAGTANVFLFDLLTQKKQLLTRMGAQQFALFPHFRSDGWIYFMVYDATLQKRVLIASDAAVQLLARTPTVTSSPSAARVP